MRDELHVMELVDAFLDGELEAAQRIAFEKRAEANQELKGLVDQQRALREGMIRLALRPTISKAYRSYRINKWLPWAGSALVAGMVLLGGIVLLDRAEQGDLPSGSAFPVIAVPVIDEANDLPDTMPTSSSAVPTDTIIMILEEGKLVPLADSLSGTHSGRTIRTLGAMTIPDTAAATVARTVDSLQRAIDEQQWRPIRNDSLKMMWGDRPAEQMN